MESLRDAQLLVKGLGTRLATEKLLEREHLVLRTTLFQHHVPVPPSLLAIQGVLLEDTVKHVGGIYQRAQVAVVASVITSYQVAEAGLAISPGAKRMLAVSTSGISDYHLLWLAQGLGTLETRNLGTEIIVEATKVQILNPFMAFGLVDGHVKDAKVQLTKVE